MVTNLCVQTTIQHAFALGYYVVVAEDATAAVDPTVQAVTLDNFRQYFGPVVASETIDRHWQPVHDLDSGAAPGLIPEDPMARPMPLAFSDAEFARRLRDLRARMRRPRSTRCWWSRPRTSRT